MVTENYIKPGRAKKKQKKKNKQTNDNKNLHIMTVGKNLIHKLII